MSRTLKYSWEMRGVRGRKSWGGSKKKERRVRNKRGDDGSYYRGPVLTERSRGKCFKKKSLESREALKTKKEGKNRKEKREGKGVVTLVRLERPDKKRRKPPPWDRSGVQGYHMDRERGNVVSSDRTEETSASRSMEKAKTRRGGGVETSETQSKNSHKYV